MATKICSDCSGSGKTMMQGMMMHSCNACNGSGKVQIVEDDIDYLLNKNTEHYKSAKKKLQDLSPSMPEKEIEKILDEELSKEEKPKRGRPGKEKTL